MSTAELIAQAKPIIKPVEAKITLETETPDLEVMERADLPIIWTDFRQSFDNLKSSADSVIASDPSIQANAKIARTTRLELRQVRIAVENKRKELGEGLLRKKQEIDSAAKQIKELIEPYEEKLLEIEQHAERVEAEKKAKLSADRIEDLSKYTTISAAIDYGALTDDEFDKMLSDAKAVFELRQAEAKRLEEERIAREKAEAEERERIRLENERLKAEAEKRDAEIRAERERIEEERRKEREEAEAKARAEREEADRKAAEEKARLQAIADQERKEREAAEEKLAAQKKAEEERIASEAEARAIAEAAPDREKLKAFAQKLRQLDVPNISSASGRTQITEKLEEFAKWIEQKAASLRGISRKK